MQMDKNSSAGSVGRRSLLDHDNNTDNDAPLNWQGHLEDLNWNASLKALEIELNSPYNHRWWESARPRVTVEWPTMRKWATQTLHRCLAPSTRNNRHLTKAQRSEFFHLFQKCPIENLQWIRFTEPLSINLENLETVVEVEAEQGPMSSNHHGNGDTDAVSEIWSFSAGNVDPLPYHAVEKLDATAAETSIFDWEPPELKLLDFQANLEALTIELNLAYNKDWNTTDTIYVKDPSLRQWASQTLIECMELSQRFTAKQRRDLLFLFEKIPRTYLRSLVFLSPVSVLGNMEEFEQETPESHPRLTAEKGSISDDDSDGSSVYL